MLLQPQPLRARQFLEQCLVRICLQRAQLQQKQHLHPASNQQPALQRERASLLALQALPRLCQQQPVPAAQASTTQISEGSEEEPWQEVRSSRLRLSAQQAFSAAGARKARKRGKKLPEQAAAAQPPASFQQADRPQAPPRLAARSDFSAP